ncbi:GTP cyclohydrolase I FolE2 [Ornithinibacillus gellani]|uniref:GTP cyclohydrolase FolE2 n=1 Tax=Ornithinibacillus gellani TaxID=2293253 RepID=UPI000F4A6854|nr:GTP cyclohydrolase FolE2 [Ornithinibacillus gellani]TQS74334.1 GTP cyclohydrolase I FolE2 [Ornithinibacillus gellani]
MDHIKTLRKLPPKAERHQIFGSVAPGPKSKPTDKESMSDLQNVQKDFLFPLDVVGISNVKHPIIVKSTLKPLEQTSVARFTFSSSILKTSKGTNMSRFTEQLHIYQEKGLIADFGVLKQFTKELAERLKQEDATVELTFPWFYERKGPQMGIAGLNHADVTMKVTYDVKKGFQLEGKLSVFITTLCPCSKEISEYSAHNQRGEVVLTAGFRDDFDHDSIDWKVMLLEAAESNASSRLHPVLKRPDEKMVTETAYENPRFVEDVVRLVAADLYEMPFVRHFKVSCRNEESIHMHDAIASLSYNKEEDIYE